MPKPRIKKNDQVLVIAGKDRGVRGKVLRVFPSTGRALVEGVNIIKKHTRPNPQQQVQGGVLEREAPIVLSNLMLVCPESGQPSRVGRQRQADGQGVRVVKKSGVVLG